VADSVKLTTPRLRIVLDDGAEHTVQTLNIDLLTFDRERARRGWPNAQDAPIVWLNYLAFSALRRESAIPTELTLAEFERKALEVSAIGDDEVPPTLPVPEDG
jgi:hypothetical protein